MRWSEYHGVPEYAGPGLQLLVKPSNADGDTVTERDAQRRAATTKGP